jgi:hypothetical protein
MSRVVIQGNASGTGDFTIAAPNSNTDRTLTLPDVAGTVLTSGSNADFPAGSVLQVVSTTKTDTFSSGSTSFVDVTGMSANITPASANNKILVSYNLNVSNPGAGYSSSWKIVRNSTDIGIGDASGSKIRTTSQVWADTYGFVIWHPNASFLDSPSSTSQLTYKIQAMTHYGASFPFFLNRGQAEGDSAHYGRTISTITLMEIAG